MKKTRAFFAGLGVYLLLLVVTAAQSRADFLYTVPSRDSSFNMSLHVPFTSIPEGGAVPVLLAVSNNTQRRLTWTVELEAQRGYTYPHQPVPVKVRREITVEGMARKNFELLVPLPVNRYNSAYYYYRNSWIRGNVWGDGVEHANFSLQTNQLANTAQPLAPYALLFNGASRALGYAVTVPSDLKVTYSGHNFAGSNLTDTRLLGSDWRGLSGVESIWSTWEEWENLPSFSRLAVKDWMIQGGTLFIIMPTNGIRLSDLEIAGDSMTLGLGGVRLVKDGPLGAKTPSLEEGVFSVKSSPYLQATAKDYPADWALGNEIPATEVNAVLIFILMLLYAALAGPINLYKFAGRDKRYRLYWTTPLLALGATISLVSLIVIKDGTGGWGYRQSAYLIVPEENKVLVVQEQVARTGLVLNQSFTTSDEYLMSRVNFSTYSYPMAGAFTLSENFAGGEWFGSRSVQAHLLQSIKSSRARVEILNHEQLQTKGEAPVVRSAIDAVLKEFEYVDSTGKRWSGKNINPGEKVTLSPGLSDRPFWLNDFVSSAGTGIELAVERIEERKDVFYALSEDAAELRIATLPSLHWRSDQAVFLGPVTKVSL